MKNLSFTDDELLALVIIMEYWAEDPDFPLGVSSDGRTVLEDDEVAKLYYKVLSPISGEV